MRHWWCIESATILPPFGDLLASEQLSMQSGRGLFQSQMSMHDPIESARHAREVRSERLRLHPQHHLRSAVKRVWSAMVGRCHRPNSANYKWYGSRGVYVCDQWRHDSEEFFLWAVANGYSPGLSIERKDNDGPYAPWNCTFADMTTQANNTRRNRRLEWNGINLSMSQWSRRTGISRQLIYQRLGKGWPMEEVLSKPNRNREHKRYE